MFLGGGSPQNHRITEPKILEYQAKIVSNMTGPFLLSSLDSWTHVVYLLGAQYNISHLIMFIAGSWTILPYLPRLWKVICANKKKKKKKSREAKGSIGWNVKIVE